MLHCVGVVAKRLCAAAEPAVAHKGDDKNLVSLCGWSMAIFTVECRAY